MTPTSAAEDRPRAGSNAPPRPAARGNGLLRYEEALERLLALPFTPEVEEVSLPRAAGRVLARSVASPWPLPRFDASAMDGYAVRSSETAPGVTRRPAGESAAGRPFRGEAPPGSIIRISTGAEVPAGFDAVVPYEDTEAHPDGRITFRTPAGPGTYVRRRGSDVAEGTALLPPGTRLTSASLAFLSSYNLPTVSVFRPPRIGIVASGDEIRLLGAPLQEGEIIGSSLYYLLAELEACGTAPHLYGVSPDRPEDFRALMTAALEASDLLVTTAGVSVGPHDIVGDGIRALGAQVHFWKVAVRPGKPMLVSSFGARHHFGFPGNPVSTVCNTEIFLKPFLRRAFGMAPAVLPTAPRRLVNDCPRDAQRLFFAAGVLEGHDAIRILPNQNSGNLLNAALADGYALVDPGQDVLRAGTLVPVLPIRQGL